MLAALRHGSPEFGACTPLVHEVDGQDVNTTRLADVIHARRKWRITKLTLGDSMVRAYR
jgi:hypothetical protein